ncbi:KDEL motif-containing protein 1 [Tetrabaena socialis]|uniref:KDEL motif-containing protein 1 n=1 Tax=Tetrabaena socialis TaxID=47790 RepID=A0A2J8A785_9CHLO|nr:KDEL motif-containing protein 1 [Tetrabaena socialis]|eukprot:PNH08365.1 KDEL motif-containing protein 1 [Tetrabaena socialis]
MYQGEYSRAAKRLDPWQADMRRVAWNRTQATSDTAVDITLWITASQWYFQKFAGELEFPDMFFFMSDQDGGWCGNVDSGRCPLPSFSISKNTAHGMVDLLYPFMVGCDHPLYDFPAQLKHKQAFFSGRPNWGGSAKEFPGVPPFWSRQYMANLSFRHPDKLQSGIMADPAQYPNHTIAHDYPMRDHARWQYLLHLDGVTYSYRLSRIMHANSVILKEETVWPEYFVRAMREGVHYLPILKTGPDDVLDIMMQYENRTSELRQIAFNAQQFALRFLCPKARMLYMRRLLIEYKSLFFHNGRNDMQVRQAAGPEYFVRAMREGVHYLPILKTGPDDVLDIMLQYENRTSELRQIAFNAQQFALRFLCPKARMLYMRRLLTEYKSLFFHNGRNDMQDFIDEALVPIIRAREQGDMNFTYMGIRPWAPGG